MPVVLEVLTVTSRPINKLEPSVDRAAPFYILLFAHRFKGWTFINDRLERNACGESQARGPARLQQFRIPDSELSETLFPDQCSKRAHSIKALVLRQHLLRNEVVEFRLRGAGCRS